MAVVVDSQLHLPSHERVEPGSVNIPVGKFPATYSTAPENPDQIASDIVDRLNDALVKDERQTLSGLFLDNSYWRDHLCFSWDFHTITGPEGISAYVSGAPSTKIEINRSSAMKAPQAGPIDAFGDVHGVQFFITIETDVGRGNGVIRLAQDDGKWKIFNVFTSLGELKGHEEAVYHNRPVGVQHGEQPGRKNWQDRRNADVSFEGKDPAVVIVGM
jgi:hypothetical protein